MESRTWIGLSVLAILGLMIYAGTVLAQRNDRVTLCHRPPGSAQNAHTITVGKDLLPAHQAHGDTLGACPVSPSS
jgi:hypothetical protein